MAKIIDHNGFWRFPKTKISREGVFPYAGWQVGNEEEPDKIFMVYRPYEELSNHETLKSFDGVPFIEEHEMIGEGYTPVDERPASGTLYNVIADEPYMYGDIVVYSESVKDSIANGKKELSLGYLCYYEKQKGIFQGQVYDYVQRGLLGNHIALVDKGRMGSSVRVQDSMGNSKVVDLTKKSAQDSLNLRKFQVAGKSKAMRLVFDTITINESEYMLKSKNTQSFIQALISMATDEACVVKTENLLCAAFDACGEEEAKDEKEDKRKLIREVMAISAKKNEEFKGGEKEKVETIAKKLEELGYNNSEAGNGDEKEEVEDSCKDEEEAKDESKEESADEKEEEKKSEEKSEDEKEDSEEAKDEEETKEEPKEEKKAEDSFSMDEAIKIAMKNIQDAMDFYNRCKPFTGEFEYKGKMINEIAQEATKILKLECGKDEALATMNGYLAAAKISNPSISQDEYIPTEDGEDEAWKEYLNK